MPKKFVRHAVENFSAHLKKQFAESTG